MMLASETAILEPVALSTRRRVRRGDEGHGKVVGIVGAGFSGTMAAMHLRRALPSDWVVVPFDRSGRFARGPAYAETGAPHLPNVRSANMSALPDDPGHFERWLASQAGRWPGEAQVTEAGTFASRRLYGRYLRALLYDEMTLSGGRVRLCSDDVVGRASARLHPKRRRHLLEVRRRQVELPALVDMLCLERSRPDRKTLLCTAVLALPHIAIARRTIAGYSAAQ